jgi:hypothetical protein
VSVLPPARSQHEVARIRVESVHDPIEDGGIGEEVLAKASGHGWAGPGGDRARVRR